VARVFLLANVEGGQVISQKIVECTGCEGFGRIQLLRDNEANVLICGGIKAFYRDLLQASGLAVISNVSSGVTDALGQYVSGSSVPDREAEEPVEPGSEIPLEDLVCWTQELFAAHGYRVKPGAELAPFPVDLVAEIECPVCHKPVRVAICCGAHTYRPDQEVKLLHRAAGSGYHARAYVRSSTPGIARCCRDYEIELIDPDAGFASCDHPVKGRIPVLQSVVRGHEAASGGRLDDNPNRKQ
jgi:predicted Fe-Mo cluster-binding NifX family protein